MVEPVELGEAKLLFLDIETVPMLLRSFTLYPKGGFQPESIYRDWYISCACWRWAHKKQIESVAVDPDAAGRYQREGGDPPDAEVTKKLGALLHEADIVVAHNGDGFDLPMIRARMIVRGHLPHAPVRTVDTLKQCRRHFRFPSNKLSYVARALGVEEKMATEKGLWERVAAGDAKALRKMVAYCRGDIRVLEAVYHRLLPFMTSHPNLGMYHEDPTVRCPNCGSDELTRKGWRTTDSRRYRRYRCRSCGKYPSARLLNDMPPILRD